MKHILFIAPDKDLYAAARRVCRKDFPGVKVVEGLLGEGVRQALKHSRQGVNIFITRGKTAVALREAALPGVVVEVPYTAFDYLRAVEQARTISPRVGVAVFPEMAPPAFTLNELLDLGLIIELMDTQLHAEQALDAVTARGAGAVIVGTAARNAATEKGIPYVPLRTGDEAIIQSLRQAEHIAAVQAREDMREQLLGSVVSAVREGVVITDASLQVLRFSPPARGTLASLLEADRTESPRAGVNLGDIWPELRGKKAFPKTDVTVDERLVCRGVECLCNRTVLRAKGKMEHLVVTFRELDELRGEARSALGGAASDAGANSARHTFDMILGNATATRAAINEAKEYALTESPICITGETGTGKSVFAQSIHNYSRRVGGPYVVVNCALLTPQAIEPYIPGKGAAHSAQGGEGVFDAAFGGTIYLDEIADMDLATQNLLAALFQQRKRLAAVAGEPFDVRFIAGTRHDIPARIKSGRFSANLYYLLNVLQLSLPSLDERKEDIPELARHFLDAVSKRKGVALSLSDDAYMHLYRYSWSGNIRELANIVERIAATCPGGVIPGKTVRAVLEKNRPHSGAAMRDLLRDDALEQVREALREAKGRHGLAAAKLGIDRSTLWRRMKKLGLK